MCEMLAMSCNSSASIQFSFTGFARRGGCTGDHVDGWGVAFHEADGCRIFIDTQRASESALARFVREQEFRAQVAIAHIRKATQGAVSLANCHPFQREWMGRQWSFCHNGDLKAFHPVLRGRYRTVGGTDSERAFCWLLQEMQRRLRPARGRVLNFQQVAPVLHELALEAGTHGNFNFLLTDGDALYVHCTSKLHRVARAHPFPRATLRDCDLSLDLGALNAAGDRMVIVATEPLTGEPWEAFSPRSTQVFVRGEAVWERVADPLSPAPKRPASSAKAEALIQP